MKGIHAALEGRLGKMWSRAESGTEWYPVFSVNPTSQITTRHPERDLIITNRPFSLAMEFLRKSLDEAGTVIYLLRLNMLGSQVRRDFWNNRPPTHLFPLARRPSFTGNGTDATEYTWFAWDRGGLIRVDGWLKVL